MTSHGEDARLISFFLTFTYKVRSSFLIYRWPIPSQNKTLALADIELIVIWNGSTYAVLGLHMGCVVRLSRSGWWYAACLIVNHSHDRRNASLQWSARAHSWWRPTLGIFWILDSRQKWPIIGWLGEVNGLSAVTISARFRLSYGLDLMFMWMARKVLLLGY